MILSVNDAEASHYQLVDQTTGLIIKYATWADDKKGVYKVIRVKDNKAVLDKNGEPIIDTRKGNIKLKRIQRGFKVSPHGEVKIT